MKYASLKELEGLATVGPAAARPMSRRERLLRWASLLEADPSRRLKPLLRVELYAPAQRDLMRRDDSPLSLAYADPLLRAEGLAGDQLGDGRSFFGLSDGDIHALVCDCRYGGAMRAGDVARRTRALAHPNPLRRLWARIWL
ncbi:MAG TPA: hypothetical protein VMU93_01660 [Caulobacteraceae bacterium]|nr:hypothetical protein [Caulobacteraceae bacterium]